MPTYIALGLIQVGMFFASSYGWELEDKGWIAAVDLATEAVVSDLIQRAQ